MDNIKMNFRELGCKGVDKYNWLRTGTSGRLVNSVLKEDSCR